MKRILPALLLILLMLILSSCSANNKLLFVYPDGDKYSFGNTVIDEVAAARIRTVDIQWTSGSVDVRFDPAETVTIEETCKRELLMSEQVHWFLDGNVLYIKDCASGSFTDHEMISFTKKNKSLTVTLPESMRFAEFNVVATSGRVETGMVHADQISVHTTSGDARLVCSDTKNVSLFSTSGSISFGHTGKLESLKVNTTSGGFSGTAGEVDTVTIESASGAISAVLEKVRTVKASATSGNVSLTVAEEPESVALTSTSGDVSVQLPDGCGPLSVSTTAGKVTLFLPDSASFTATVNTASGKITDDLGLKETVPNSHIYVQGDGKASFSISTTSGDVRFRKLG